jgi:hypothetical protein
MSNLVFGIVTLFILGIALESAIAVCYLGSIVYENNLPLIPNGNSACLRLLPQVSHIYNLADSASFTHFK